MRLRSHLRSIFLLSLSWLIVIDALAANQVAVTAAAKENYTKGRLDENNGLRPATYVFMQGKYFSGTTRDHSIEKMPFRRIAEYLVPELAKQNFVPSKELEKSDLLLVVHWGTTVPRVTTDGLRAKDGVSTSLAENSDVLNHGMMKDQAEGDAGDAVLSAMTDLYNPESGVLVEQQIDNIAEQTQADFSAASNSQLLGYKRILHRLGKNITVSATEETLRFDLTTERYFLVVMAYDLREKMAPGRRRNAVWTLHVNIRSPGNNFEGALSRMSVAASNYFGKDLDEVKTVVPRDREGKVIIPPFRVIGTVD